MKIHGTGITDCIEEFSDQLCIKISNHRCFDITLIREIWATGQINGTKTQRIIHGKHKGTISFDTNLVPYRFFDGLSQNNTGIFYRVVSIYLQISLHLAVQVKKTVFFKAFQHMIKETDPCLNSSLAGPIQF